MKDIGCDFRGKIIFDKSKRVVEGEYSCQHTQPPPISDDEFTLMHRALCGERIATFSDKRCLCGTFRFKVRLYPTGDGRGVIEIEAVEKLSRSHILNFEKRKKRVNAPGQLDEQQSEQNSNSLFKKMLKFRKGLDDDRR